jgi:hypothetical protein
MIFFNHQIKNQENILQKVFEEKTSENYKISLPVESGFLS